MLQELNIQTDENGLFSTPPLPVNFDSVQLSETGSPNIPMPEQS